MKKIIILIAIFFLLPMNVMAYGITTKSPSTVAPNSNFSVVYEVDARDLTTRWGVLFVIDSTGGCTPGHIPTGFFTSSPTQEATFTFTSPGSGNCTFTGDPSFVDANGIKPKKEIPPYTVIITADLPNCGNGKVEPPENCGLCPQDVKCPTNSFCKYGNCIEDNRTLPKQKKTCKPNWVTEPWGLCQNNKQQREVYDKNKCGTLNGKPDSVRSCYPINPTGSVVVPVKANYERKCFLWIFCWTKEIKSK